jgi:hypothetical protein
MNRAFKLFFLLLLAAVSCSGPEPVDIYKPFARKTWPRFENLRFEVPLSGADKSCDVLFYIRVSRDFPNDALPFNMVMNTPSGEERINEYTLKVKSAGGAFLAPFSQELCEVEILLKHDLSCSAAGTLTIEIENLTPRLETPGIAGAGVRLRKL